MPNQLGGYDLTIFVNEALRFLRLRLGIAGRINRGYNPQPTQKGRTIQIPVRSSFTAQDAPSDPQNIDAGQVDVTLDHWKEVKFALPDDEGQFTEERIIEDHVEPAAYALAADVETRLAALYTQVPWAVDRTSDVVADIIAVRQRLADNGAPMTDRMLHLAVDHTTEAALLNTDIFKSAQIVGGTDNQDALMEGFLGRRFGFEIFADGVLPAHTSGTVVSAGSDIAGALTADADQGATQIAIGSLSGTQTLVKGDSFVIAGHTQRYTVQANKALVDGAATIDIFPALAQDYDSGAVVTFEKGDEAAIHADAFGVNLGFHRDWATMATAPLQSHRGSRQAAAQGIQVETIADDETGIILRGRMWYDPDLSRLMTAFDLLYGFKVLDPNLATLLRRDV